MRLLLNTATVILVQTLISTAVSSSRSLSDSIRLPRHIEPEQYFIELEPDFENDSFNGSIIIEINVKEESYNITLHAKQLEIDASSIVLAGENQTLLLVNTNYTNDDREFYIIFFNESLKANTTYSLSINNFSGTLNLENAGFYIAKYKNEDGVERKLGTTQFAAASARRAFPCFDEPALKANFTLSMIRPENYITISNFPANVTSQYVTDGRYKDIFKTTVKMSSYLLAFIVSEFSSTDQLGIHRVFARPQEINAGKGQYALETGQAALNVIADYVRIPYALEKIDQAAIPDDYFHFGAMENWGLITYRESRLLYSNETTVTSEKQKTCSTIAHEFAHQWFGNLVTPKWWEYIWLNEGFATYFTYYAASFVEPDWDLMDQFTIQVLQLAFESDALESTRPMNQDVASNSALMKIFDKVAYEKSASVIRMLETVLTTPVFKRGLQVYLTNRAYNSAEPSDLYNAFQETLDASNITLPDGLSVSSIMTKWDSLAGYPVINVDINYANGNVTFKQSRFLLKNVSSNAGSDWPVPINYATRASHDFSNVSTDFWLTSSEQTINVLNLTTEDWFIVNKGQRGYYRVNYNDKNWKLLIGYLKKSFNHIHRLNRAQLIDDAFNLARSGRLAYEIPLELATYLVKENDYIPFYSFFTALNFISTELSGSEQFGNFQRYLLDLLSGIYEQLGAEEAVNDTHTEKLNRVNVLTWLCKYGHEQCRAKAASGIQNWKTSGVIIPPNLQAPFFCGAMISASEEDWNFLYTKYANATDAGLRTRILNGLGCNENSYILKRYLDLGLAENSSFENVLASVYNAGNVGLSFALNYVKEHLNKISNSTVVTVLKEISARSTTNTQLNELTSIVEQNKLDETILASAKENVEWCEKNLSALEDWFANYAKGTAPPIISSKLLTIVFSIAVILVFL